ncbi:glucan-binding protein [Lachnospiraceae bacterium 54-53]
MKRLSLYIRIACAAAASIFLLLASGTGLITSFAHTKDESIYLAGIWQKDENGWRFFNQWNSSSPAGKWAEYQGNSYYFMDNGYMATGWHMLNGRWYYFNPYPGKQEGSMVTGWINDHAYGGWFYTNRNGIMVTGWHKIDGYWYYFNPEPDGVLGLMAANRMIDDAYVDSNGRMNELQ